jgi:hypothetical protein
VAGARAGVRGDVHALRGNTIGACRPMERGVGCVERDVAVGGPTYGLDTDEFLRRAGQHVDETGRAAESAEGDAGA